MQMVRIHSPTFLGSTVCFISDCGSRRKYESDIHGVCRYSGALQIWHGSGLEVTTSLWFRSDDRHHRDQHLRKRANRWSNTR